MSSEQQALPTVYSIGHSLLSKARFIARLQEYGIQVLLDVRSSPSSSRAPHFSRPVMKEWLGEVGVIYSFGGRHLGGRPSDPGLYERGQVSYDKMAATPGFTAALRRLLRGAKRSRVAIMCAEADPIECHRFLLIGRYLSAHAVPILHVHSNGAAESQSEGETRLLRELGLAQSDFFKPSIDALHAAYRAQASRVAYRISEPFSAA